MEKRNRICNYDLVAAMPVGTPFNHRHVNLDISKENFRVRIRNIDKTLKGFRGKHDGKPETLFIIDETMKAEMLSRFDKDELGNVYYLINPNGKQVQIKNASRFCREHGICAASFSKLMSGKIAQGHCKGWRLDKDKTIAVEKAEPVVKTLTELEKEEIKKKELFYKFMSA